MNKDEQVSLRKSTSYDAEQIFIISSECNFSGWLESDYRDETERENSILLSAGLKGEESVVGFILGRLTEVLKSGAAINEQRELDIINLGIRVRFRRRGIGGKLLSKLLESAAGENVGSVWLDVRQSNVGAMEFYQTHGFAPIQIRKGFYANPPDNAVLMKLTCSNIVERQSKT